ncbi:MAG: hypothetical protein OWQ51_13090 [Pyrobaculum arsenaticum]|uniref:Uncharacterized protein n=2 Tax=Pyrobaculum arsenaticum TaxID=121277 RepID=A4WKV0_PYRAR|nr:hypothetical protein [Pyrobaculum arsenaticum]ABP51017.1 hypothetical protein Pars_1460 [Pyrobaculum arsenaticum DSM 13514]MCY0891876.1 hypothetical protein [Pyrobaculum arsenaticum]NYR15258.1 hypothetical protein [Pyrobaculum arsenaticum]
MDVVKLRLKGVPLSTLGDAVDEALKMLGYAQLSDMDVLRLMVAGASPAVLARATGTTPGIVKRRAWQAYKSLIRGAAAREIGQPPRPRETSQPPESRERGEERGTGQIAGNEWVRILRSRS